MWISSVMKLVVQDYFEALWNTCKLVAFSSLTVAPLAVSCATPPVWTALPGQEAKYRDCPGQNGTVGNYVRTDSMHLYGVSLTMYSPLLL